MTRKDYELIAGAIRKQVDLIYAEPDAGVAERASVQLVALGIADALESANPRFNRKTFLQACGTW